MNFKRIVLHSATLFLGFTMLSLLNSSCKHDGVPADQMAPVPFANVQQVYSEYCVSCHPGNNGGRGGGSRMDFTTYDGILSSVTPGNSSSSKSYQTMISTFQIMPPNGVVPTPKRTLIRLWIDQGAKPE